jgi:IclR family KDG regulon transcriptional repressor
MTEYRSVSRALRTIELLAESRDGIGVTVIAEMLGVNKASASRLLSTLATHGYAERDSDTRRYQIGPRIVSLSRIILSRMAIRDRAKPFLNELVERTGECAHLAILAQGQALYIDQAESPSSLRVTTGVGTLAPLHCTALGKVLLTYSNAPIPTDLRRFTPRTITDPKALTVHLNQVRSSGYATDDEEFEIGVRCIAVPVFDYRDRMVGAIGISGPAGRMTLERLPDLTRTVIEIGEELTRQLGCNQS